MAVVAKRGSLPHKNLSFRPEHCDRPYQSQYGVEGPAVWIGFVIRRRGMAAPPAVQINLRRKHHFLHPLFHLLWRHIFHMRGDAPQMSERILNEAIAVSVKLVLNWLQDFRSLGLRALNHAIDVGKVHIQAHRTSADSGGAGVSRSR